MDEFNGFEDFISSFHIYRGRAKSRDEEQDTIVGEFKVGEVLCFKLTIVFRLDFQPFWECGCLSSSHYKERGGEIRDTRDTTKRKETDMSHLISVSSHVLSLLNEWSLSLEPVCIVCKRISGNEAYYNSLICRLVFLGNIPSVPDARGREIVAITRDRFYLSPTMQTGGMYCPSLCHQGMRNKA